MLPTEPLPLHHSWPIFEQGLRFRDGLLDVGYSIESAEEGPFCCDLTSSLLSWTDSTFALFGLPSSVAPVRDVILPMYRPESRSALERLRNHAIRHRRGFTIDAEIDAPGHALRWFRIIAMPDVEDGRAVRLRGLHQDVTHEYR